MQYKGDPCLVPARSGDATIERCKQLAAQIPGLRDDGGDAFIVGPVPALAACLELAGQKAPSSMRAQSWTGAVHIPESTAGLTWMPAYQQQAAAFIAERMATGVMINDDVGLGKTFEAIAGLYLADWRAYKGMPSNIVKVVLCPASLKRQWASEVEKWYDLHERNNGECQRLCEQKIHIIYPKGDKRSKLPCPPDVEWVIAYYMDADTVINDILPGRSYYCIIDEAHNLQGFQTNRTEQVTMLRTFAIGAITLTASELFNRSKGLYQLLNLTSPGLWGSPEDWAIRYANGRRGDFGLEWGELGNVPELNNQRDYYRFRRVRQDVGDQLPFDTRYQTVWLEPPPGNLRLLGDAARSGMVSKEYMAKLNDFKLPIVAESIKSDIIAGLPGITFTWTREQAELLGAMIPGSMVAHGQDGRKDRIDEVYKYYNRARQLGHVPQLIATIDSLGVGGNLQMFRCINLASLHYTAELIRQAIGRVARFGQEFDVLVRVFACRYSPDEHMITTDLFKLAEAQKLDGRAEQDKKKLADALSLVGDPKKKLMEIFQKYQQQEAAGL